MNNSARTSLSNTFHERLVEPARRVMTLPDSGIAFQAGRSKKTIVGSQYSGDEFWEFITSPNAMIITLGNQIAQALLGVFGNTNGFVNDDILVDILVRTPVGNHWIYNVIMHTNGLSGDKQKELAQNLQNHKSINVNIIYNGGNVAECTPVSYRTNYPDVTHVVSEANSLAYNAGQTVVNSVQGVAGYSTIAGPPSNVGGAGNNASSIPATIPGTFKVDKNDPIAQWVPYINSASKIFNVDPALIGAIMRQESQGNPKAYNKSSSCSGLMQLNPQYFATDYFPGAFAKLPGLTPSIFNPATNIYSGANYIKTLQGFGHGPSWVIQAYNAGAGDNPSSPYNPNFNNPETIDYLSKVTSYYKGYQAISAELNMPKVLQRQEVNYLDQSSYGTQTGNVAVNGGGTP